MKKENSQTLYDHLTELRSRLVRISLSVSLFSGIGYLLHEFIITILRAPLVTDLYYTTPGGGFLLTLNVSLLFGVICSLPVIIYQLGKFIEPVFTKMNRYSLLTFVIWSLNLALAGILFAYFISFPAAIQFLTDFAPASLVAIITAEEYLRFAVFYIGGFALIFQLPLLITFIDSNRPLNPQSMIKYQRHLIVGSFILAAILTPTPDPVNQLMMAIPPIVLYYISVVIVYLRRYQRQKNAMPIIEKVRIPVQTPHPETHVVPVNWLPAEPRTLIMDIRPAYRS